jgi:hypothetical protein
MFKSKQIFPSSLFIQSFNLVHRPCNGFCCRFLRGPFNELIIIHYIIGKFRRIGRRSESRFAIYHSTPLDEQSTNMQMKSCATQATKKLWASKVAALVAHVLLDSSYSGRFFMQPRFPSLRLPKPTEPKPTEPKPTEPKPTVCLPCDPSAYAFACLLSLILGLVSQMCRSGHDTP